MPQDDSMSAGAVLAKPPRLAPFINPDRFGPLNPHA